SSTTGGGRKSVNSARRPPRTCLRFRGKARDDLLGEGRKASRISSPSLGSRRPAPDGHLLGERFHRLAAGRLPPMRILGLGDARQVPHVGGVNRSPRGTPHGTFLQDLDASDLGSSWSAPLACGMTIQLQINELMPQCVGRTYGEFLV